VVEALVAGDRQAVAVALEQHALLGVERAHGDAQHELARVVGVVAERALAAVQLEHLAAQLGGPRALGAAGAVERGLGAPLEVQALLSLAQLALGVGQVAAQLGDVRACPGCRDGDAGEHAQQCWDEPGLQLLAVRAERERREHPDEQPRDDPCHAEQQGPASCRCFGHVRAVTHPGGPAIADPLESGA